MYECEWFHSVYYELFHSRPSDVYLRVKLMRDIVSLANKIIELYTLLCSFFFQIGFEYNRYWDIVFVVAYLWLISSLHLWLLFSFNMLPVKTGTVPMLIVSIQMMFVYSLKTIKKIYVIETRLFWLTHSVFVPIQFQSLNEEKNGRGPAVTISFHCKPTEILI